MEVTPKRKKIFSTMIDGDFVLRSNLTDREDTIATHTVLKRRLYKTTDDFIRLRLKTRETFTFTTGAGVTTHTLTLARNIVDSPVIPMLRENVRVIRRSPAPVIEWTTFTVTLPRTIALTGLVGSTAYTIEVQYLHGYGSLAIYARYGDRQAGGGNLLFNQSIETINLSDISDIRTGFRMNPDIFIPEDARIEVMVNSTAPVVLFGPTETAITSPFATQSFISFPLNIFELEHFEEGTKEWAQRQLAGL